MSNKLCLLPLPRDTEHVTNFHKQCQNCAEKCHTTSHRTLTDYQKHCNGGKRAKKNRWTWSRLDLVKKSVDVLKLK